MGHPDRLDREHALREGRHLMKAGEVGLRHPQALPRRIGLVPPEQPEVRTVRAAEARHEIEGLDVGHENLRVAAIGVHRLEAQTGLGLRNGPQLRAVAGPSDAGTAGRLEERNLARAEGIDREVALDLVGVDAHVRDQPGRHLRGVERGRGRRRRRAGGCGGGGDLRRGDPGWGCRGAAAPGDDEREHDFHDSHGAIASLLLHDVERESRLVPSGEHRSAMEPFGATRGTSLPARQIAAVNVAVSGARPRGPGAGGRSRRLLRARRAVDRAAHRSGADDPARRVRWRRTRSRTPSSRRGGRCPGCAIRTASTPGSAGCSFARASARVRRRRRRGSRDPADSRPTSPHVRRRARLGASRPARARSRPPPGGAARGRGPRLLPRPAPRRGVAGDGHPARDRRSPGSTERRTRSAPPSRPTSGAVADRGANRMMNDHSPPSSDGTCRNADERPADGQLETVLRRTAIEPQYRPWVARLRTRPELGVRLGWQLRYGAGGGRIAARHRGGDGLVRRFALGPGHDLRRGLDVNGHRRRQHPDARRGTRSGARRALRGRLLDQLLQPGRVLDPVPRRWAGRDREWPSHGGLSHRLAAGSTSPHSSGGTTTTPRPDTLLDYQGISWIPMTP